MNDQQRIGTILWGGKWLIALSLTLSVALAVFITQHSKKVYAASAIIQVASSPSGTQQTGGDQNQGLQAAQTLATEYATLIRDRNFLSEIRPQVGHGVYTLGTLENAITASAIKDTALIKITAEEASPDLARLLDSDVANAFVKSVATDAAKRAAAQKSQIEAQISQLTGELASLGSSDAERSQSLRLARAALTQQLAQIEASGIAQANSVTLTAPPTASSAPVKPRPILNILAGVLLGLLLGVGLAWLRSRLDRGLHTAEEAEELLGVPVLAAIPLRKRFAPDDPVVGEAYDILRANLAFISMDQALQVITFTSFNPGEGKTSTVEGLAYAAVRGGMSVLIVDGDVRTASLSTNFGARAMPGLTSVIVGTSSLDEAILEIEPGLYLLPAGPTPPNPPSLLTSVRMREVVAQMREEHTLVIFDSPPVAHLADASILAAVSDGVALVGRIGVTSRADLPGAVANLRHSPTPTVGLVLLRPQLIDETYYPVAVQSRDSITA